MTDAIPVLEESEEEGIRLARRRPVDTAIVLSDPDGHGEVALRSRDVSVSGLFVYSSACVRPGSEFVCRFQVGGGATVEALGRVSRIVLNADRPAASGMGIEFTRLAREARDRLVAFTTPPHGDVMLAALG